MVRSYFFSFLLIRPPTKSPLFPYTTLFRSPERRPLRVRGVAVLAGDVLVEAPAERDVDHLDAAADREERHVVRDLPRSEEHTSELQSPDHLVCRLLLEKKK